MKDIIFFVFDPSPRIDRRITEFIENGYNVEVYGFANEINIKYCKNKLYTYNQIGYMGPKLSYLTRIRNLKLIIKIIKSKKSDNVLFYFFTLNVSIASLFCHKIKYIYEESDMLFDRFRSHFLRWITVIVNKCVIRRSTYTVFTSAGFSRFYFGPKAPDNVIIIPNKVNKNCLLLPKIPKQSMSLSHLKIGFVGNIRYETILNISQVVNDSFPNFEFHYYGNTEGLPSRLYDRLVSQKGNVVLHGLFKNPDDLPKIYSNLDFVVCAYDVTKVNPRYAEPNKLYEALYYDTPMIVSENSFLADKVLELGIGFSVNADDFDDIRNQLNNITVDIYQQYVANIKIIPKEQVVNINKELFYKVSLI